MRVLVAGRAEPLLGTALSRPRWAGGGLVVTLAGTTIALGAGGLGTGASRAFDTGDAGEVGRLTVGALAYLPAVLVLASIAVLLWGWFPRLALAAWAALAVSFVIGYLGELLDLPGWVIDVSPFSHVSSAPLATVTGGPLIVMTVLAAAVVIAGLVGFRRRDVAT